ncbi:MAG: DnaJ domain-containing protein, partial [Malacoplasma sp.]
CHFLSAFIDEEYGDSIVDNLLDLSLPSSWNPNSFEEFIKINKFNSESSNHDSNYTNYYKILNLDSNASISEIKKAYKDLIAKYHPDVCKEIDADKKTIELNKAYEILSDVKLKKEYDEMYF